MHKNTHIFKAPSERNRKGSTLALIAAVTMGLVVALIFFCLNYARLLGSNAEQKKAIEASALAAANDISSIVINTPQMGYVSLSDQAPIGKFTVAGDQFFMPVRGINTIIGTARLDAIIADQIPNGGVLKTLAANDLADAKLVITQLETVVKAALTKANSPKALDRDGTKVNAYTDAQNAYVQNLIRMTGSSSYVPNSLVLTLGSLNIPSDTNIPIPQPTSIAPLAANLTNNNTTYKAFIDIPYKGTNYVFGGIGDTPRLVDVRNFVTNLAGVSYQVPTIVKAEADEIIKTSQTPNGDTFHSAACAQACSNFDPKPAPGTIAVEFPDGPVPELTNPSTLLTLGGTADVLTSPGGDYPVTGPALAPGPNPWPPNVASQTIGDSWAITLYDWIRRGGTKVDIKSVVSMQTTNFTPTGMIDWYGELSASPPLTNITQTYPTSTGKKQIPMGIMHCYKWDPNGQVQYKPLPCAPYPFEVISQNQLYGEVASINAGAFKSNMSPTINFDQIKIPMPAGIKGQKGKKSGTISATVLFTQYFDIYVRDQCRVQGTINGGKHGGEPLNDALVVSAPQSNNVAWAPFVRPSGADYGGTGFGAGEEGGALPPVIPPIPPNGNGNGSPPLITAQSDFGDPPAKQVFPPPYVIYATGPSGGAMRPTYQTSALTGSIRFRRELQITGFLLNTVSLVSTTPTDLGYLGGKQKVPGVTYSAIDKTSGADVDVVDDFKDK
ncbi:MAG: hypothetical protein HYX67_14110 [Candidatus Melainabacteria bacterium]|nr:hypothetical protein [Candidatus Melainabacteria bacterium]